VVTVIALVSNCSVVKKPYQLKKCEKKFGVEISVSAGYFGNSRADFEVFYPTGANP